LIFELFFNILSLILDCSKRDKHYTGSIGKYISIDYGMNTKLILSID